MSRRRNIVDIYRRNLSTLRRYVRLLFPSPAELRLVELFGGKVIRLKLLKFRSNFPMAFVVRRPRLFKAENVKREVRVGKYYADFANDIGRIIEVDGREWHMDIVAEFDRDSYLYQRGFRVLRIKAYRLYNDSHNVQKEVISFLTN